MYTNLHQHNIGGFITWDYVSSSEASTKSAWAKSFNSGSTGYAKKDYFDAYGNMYVRAARRF